jgi:tRNA(Ile2) C34 agmatinyltransferase TiaS
LVILVLVAFAFWADSPEPDAVAGFWTGRIAAPVGAALPLRHLLRTPKEPILQARLATISPAADTVCPFCGAQMLVLGSQCSCPVCGVVRR